MANPKKKTKKKKKNPIFPMPPGPMWLGKGADATLEEKLARKMSGKAPRRFSPRIEKDMGRLAVDQATKFTKPARSLHGQEVGPVLPTTLFFQNLKT